MRPSSVALCALAALACGGGQVKKNAPAVRSAPMPGWIERAPLVEGRVYAVGHSGPTFWPQDALNNAAEDARGKLAIGLQSKMEILTKRADRGADSTHVDLVKAATDMVMQNSRIEATWRDEGGERGDAGSVWALASIELDAAKLKGPGQAVQTAGQSGVPPWLDRLPSDRGRIFAYGYSGPTFRPDDALEYAGDDAVDNLAKALRSHVQAYQLLVENNTGLSMDEFSRTARPDDEFKDLVKKKAKVEQTWIDSKGTRVGYPAGSVWALASIDVGSTKGGYQQISNEATGPALTNTGEIGPEASPRARPTSTAGTNPSPGANPGPRPGPGAVQPAKAAEPPKGLAPYPSAGEPCKPGYDSTGGWCLPKGD
jgi:hypothetical protein